MANQRYFRPWRFILPGAILGIVTLGYPVYQAIIHSFHTINMRRLNEETFVGLLNFSRLLSDHLFIRSIEITIWFTLGTTIIAVVFGMLIAGVMSSRGLRGTLKSRVLMAFFLIPFVTTPVVTAIMGRLYMWQSTYGMVNYLRSLIGLAPVGWILSTDTALFATYMTNAWRMAPLALLIFYAALMTIPDEIVESAEVDGANGISLWLHIKLPMVRFHIGFVFLIILTSAFREFDIIYGLTGGGPGRSTEALSVLVYRLGVEQGNIGMANAVSVIMLVVIAVITFIAVKFGRLGEMRE